MFRLFGWLVWSHAPFDAILYGNAEILYDACGLFSNWRGTIGFAGTSRGRIYGQKPVITSQTAVTKNAPIELASAHRKADNHLGV